MLWFCCRDKAVLMLDAPLKHHLRVHWPKAILWLVLEVDIVFLALLSIGDGSPPSDAPTTEAACKRWLPKEYDCESPASNICSKILVSQGSER